MEKNYEIGLVAGLDELKSEQQLQKLIPKIIEKAEQKFREKGIELPIEIKESLASAVVSKFTKNLKTGFESAKIDIGDYISYTAKDTKKGIDELISVDSVKFLKDQQKEKERIQKEYVSWWSQELNRLESIEKAHYNAIIEDEKRANEIKKADGKEYVAWWSAQIKRQESEQKNREQLEKEYTSWWTQELNKRESIEKAHYQALDMDQNRTKKQIEEQQKYNKVVDDTTSQFEQLKIKADGASERISRTSNRKSQEEIKKLEIRIKELNKEFVELGQSGKISGDKFNEFRNKIKNLNQEIIQAERNANKGGNAFLTLGEKFKVAAMSFALWQVVTETFYRVKQSFAEGVQAVIALDTAMVDLIKVTNETQSVYENFKQQSFVVADSIATTAEEVIKASTGFARMGYDINQSSNLGKFAIILKNVGDEIDTVDQATNSLIATMKGFNMESADAEKIVDAVNEVSNNFAVTTGDLTDGIERVSAVMSQSGVSFEQTLGLITGATEVMQDAAKASTGLRTLSERLRGIQEEGDEIVNLVPKLEDAFNGIGITLKDQNGQIRDTYSILKDLAEVYPYLDQNTKQYIGETCSPYVQKCA